MLNPSWENTIKPSPAFWRWFFFLSGIVATIAYRIIFLLDSFWIEIAWYVGTIGFIFYFGHRAMLEAKRAHIVTEYGLVSAIEQSAIEEHKKTALLYLIETTLTSKARFNSAFIFFLSLLVFVVNAAIDIYHLIIL